ncbi:MAG: hypothetical protein SPD80_05635 [Atopobium sp.]|uniref:hypothetical protein n=1 Tax=Atopobium sp. TaxID=1872650 RepID=UPI002A825A4B|nr:hypothetical protein [Atopobium sp.]MDY4523052.1 hypothetical protein [Atopobium sp.]
MERYSLLLCHAREYARSHSRKHPHDHDGEYGCNMPDDAHPHECAGPEYLHCGCDGQYGKSKTSASPFFSIYE